MTKIPTVTLSNGTKIPALGFGVFQMSHEEAEQSVATALETGYRSIDTAASYQNEEAVGRGIQQSGVPRDEIFITSKLWIADASYEGAKKAYQTSLDKLGLEYLDLYLMHQPYGDIFGAWKALVELYEAGRIKAIGVSNFSSAKLTNFVLTNRKVLGIETAPMVNQVETHPFNQEVAARKIMEEYGIVHEGWAPFAEGHHDIFTNPVLRKIAESHGKSIGQVVLRWHIQKGIVAIPKSVRKERIEENFDVFDFVLSDDEITQIADLDTSQSLVHHEDPAFVKMLFNRLG
jgi:diketogulonate reductase-like aldo/keto reductase